MNAGLRKRLSVLAAMMLLGAPAAISAPVATSSPDAAPALGLPDLGGTAHTLDEWRGKVLLVNFWASWCGPCQAEIPRLVHWQQDFGGRGLQVLGVGVDNARKLGNVRRTLGINYPVLVANPDTSGGLMSNWGDRRRFIPYTVVVDRQGRVVHRLFGEMDQDSFDEVVRPLL